MPSPCFLRNLASRFMRRTSHEKGQPLRAPAGKFRAIRAGQFILGILLMCGLAWNARAQGTRVEGSVHDATGASVQGAKVQLSANSYSAETTTDAAGMFVFDGVPAASGTVEVTADGFEPVKQSWTATAGAAPQMSFVLQPLTVSQQVVVTAARTPTPLGESSGQHDSTHATRFAADAESDAGRFAAAGSGI